MTADSSPTSRSTNFPANASPDESPLGRIARLVLRFRRFVLNIARRPRWTMMFTFGRFRFVADNVALLYRRRVLPPAPDLPSLFPGMDIDRALTNLQRDGFHTGVNIGPDVVQEIVAFAHSSECYMGGDRGVRFRYSDRKEREKRLGRPILLARYFDIEDRCPAIRGISRDPILRYLAASYLRREPGQIETRLWWSFVSEATAVERRHADQRFHYDLHDYRCIAFFFHLTDVDESSGAHTVIRGSQGRKPLRLLLRGSGHSSDEEIVAHYGAEAVLSLCGPAGFGFASDPFGYHKGAPPTNHDRLMLRVRFTIHDDGHRPDKLME